MIKLTELTVLISTDTYLRTDLVYDGSYATEMAESGIFCSEWNKMFVNHLEIILIDGIYVKNILFLLLNILLVLIFFGQLIVFSFIKKCFCF